MVETLWWKY